MQTICSIKIVTPSFDEEGRTRYLAWTSEAFYAGGDIARLNNALDLAQKFTDLSASRIGSRPEELKWVDCASSHRGGPTNFATRSAAGFSSLGSQSESIWRKKKRDLTSPRETAMA